LHGACGESGDFGFAVETHDHGAAGAVHFAKSFGEPGDAERIETGGGLIEEKYGWTMNQGAGDGDALAHAAGKSADEGIAALDEADFAEEFFGASGGRFDILKFGEKEEIFFGGEFVVDHGGVGDVAGAAVGGRVGGCAGKGELACGWFDDLRGDAEERGFAGTVAAREDYTFAGGDGEGDAAEGEETAVTFINVLEAEAGGRYARRSHGAISGTA